MTLFKKIRYKLWERFYNPKWLQFRELELNLEEGLSYEN